MLDRIPAWVRHAVIIFGAAFLGVYVKEFHQLGDTFTGFPWGPTLTQALSAAFAALLAGMIVLSGTPATRQYGAFKK